MEMEPKQMTRKVTRIRTGGNELRNPRNARSEDYGVGMVWAQKWCIGQNAFAARRWW